MVEYLTVVFGVTTILPIMAQKFSYQRPISQNGLQEKQKIVHLYAKKEK